MNPVFIKRLKSWLWRVGCYAVVGLVAVVSDSLELFSLPPIAMTMIALALGEITKYFNNKGISIGGRIIFGGVKQ